MRLSVRADGARSATLRLWKDGREWRVPMARVSSDPMLFPEHGPRRVERAHAISPRPGEDVFTCEAALPEDAGSLWYYFILEYDDGDALRAAVNASALADENLRAHPVSPLYYGDARDHCYGAGEVYGCEPPSYQITVYDPAGEGPAWMREATMMQIMVDRFHRAGEKDQKDLAPWCYYHENWYDWPDLNLELDAQEHSANDFFGGDLRGIEEKLPYIESLGVTVLYLNPIFRSPSNHKYDTGNYLQVDPSFGTEEDLRSLCAAAKKRGIRVILDGVFSHTGADSVYFNKYGTYGEGAGAYRDEKSPYRAWYRFRSWPKDYDCWWGFTTLPNVNEMEKSYRAFINGEDGVAAHWIKAGTSGWRLDVADELPMPFLRELRRRVKTTDSEATLLGEVWEDPTNKIAYGEARCYCAGDTLDSVMNYPLREAVLAFFTFRIDAYALVRRIEAMRESMPPSFFYSLMNLLGSHDKPRAINVLADCGNMQPERRYRFPLELTKEQYERGKRRLIAAWTLICALPGMPCIYYGDEAGLTGMADPFCRKTFPWGREDEELTEKNARAVAQAPQLPRPAHGRYAHLRRERRRAGGGALHRTRTGRVRQQRQRRARARARRPQGAVRDLSTDCQSDEKARKQGNFASGKICRQMVFARSRRARQIHPKEDNLPPRELT